MTVAATPCGAVPGLARNSGRRAPARCPRTQPHRRQARGQTKRTVQLLVPTKKSEEEWACCPGASLPAAKQRAPLTKGPTPNLVTAATSLRRQSVRESGPENRERTARDCPHQHGHDRISRHGRPWSGSSCAWPSMADGP